MYKTNNLTPLMKGKNNLLFSSLVGSSMFIQRNALEMNYSQPLGGCAMKSALKLPI